MAVRGVEIVERFWAEVWQPPQDPDAVDHLVTEDFVLISGGTEVRGREPFKRWLKDFQATVNDLDLEVVETFQNDSGSRVASLWRLTGTNNGVLGTTPDGRPIELLGIAVWSVREDGLLESNRAERNAFELFTRLTT